MSGQLYRRVKLVEEVAGLARIPATKPLHHPSAAGDDFRHYRTAQNASVEGTIVEIESILQSLKSDMLEERAGCIHFRNLARAGSL